MLKKALLALSGVFWSWQAFYSGTVLINGKDIKTREQFHAVFAKQLNFSQLYSKNLDSLYENLSSDFSSDSIIKIKHVNLLKAKLGTEYMDAAIQAIMDAAEDNSRVILVLE